jgi:hypothetical protein
VKREKIEREKRWVRVKREKIEREKPIHTKN